MNQRQQVGQIYPASCGNDTMDPALQGSSFLQTQQLSLELASHGTMGGGEDCF